MTENATDSMTPEIERMRMDVDIVCVGFGPATAGFLTTLNRALVDGDGQPRFESTAAPGMPLQVLCYERADDIGFGVSGVVTRARAIRASFPGLDIDQIPMATPVAGETMLYLLDPGKASRRPGSLRAADAAIRAMSGVMPYGDHAFRLPYIPPFLAKHDGLLLSLGQFLQWVGGELMGGGQVQIWPGTPVAAPLFDGDSVVGVRLADQGVTRDGSPDAGFMPGMDIHAPLTVVGDGPVGPVGRQLDEKFGLPEGNFRHEWAVGLKMVVDLPESCALEAGTVIHTFGYPEPGIFGFLYVYRNRVASLGVFVPSWFDNPARTGYRYLQHWMTHPALWKHLEGATMRSFGAKSLLEAGRRGEPVLAGDGFARIGEGSGSTNVLTGSGVDEAWATGTLLAEGVVELLEAKKPFTRDNLREAYVARRRKSWVDREAKVAARSRDGFASGFLRGMMGMGLAGLTGGKLHIPGKQVPPHARIPSIEKYYEGRIPAAEIAAIRRECGEKGLAVHDALMERAGWPAIPFDGKLLVSHQDALLMGGKVQAPGGYADHVRFVRPEVCAKCGEKMCVDMCSGQAITTNPDGGVPLFDREKCMHCGACLWNCSKANPDNPETGNVEFTAGAGGLHSAEN